MIAGISGFKRNAAAAIFRDGELAGICEQGRVVRVRDIGIQSGGFPDAALKMAMRSARAEGRKVNETITAETELNLSTLGPSEQLEHHFAHAATAFLTSPFSDALVVVCDTNAGDELSVWRGDGAALTRIPLEWQGPAFAQLYSRLTWLLGLRPGSDEYGVEALARLAAGRQEARADELLGYGVDGIRIAPRFEPYVSDAASRDLGEKASAAAAIQRRIGELILEFLGEIVRRQGAAPSLCLGGGLFFNTYFNTIIKQSGLFPQVFVPVNPGNAGLAAGCALARGCEILGVSDHPKCISPFLGPEFSNEEIKAVLDNCKLSYEFLDDSALVRQSVEALMRGELVGWFRGRLEWGTRALGNRSIFANPLAPYVLENLNRFLKLREAHRTYGLVVGRDDLPQFFDGPAASPYMECEYEVRDGALFSQICPPGITQLRVQTLESDPPLLKQLLATFGQASGTPVLVNTSFNSFHEPIVLSARDAVRVFYGSGLDMLVVGNFVLRK